MGYLFIAIAATLISFGSYVLAFSLVVDQPRSVFQFLQGIDFIGLLLGIFLNLVGSLFWAGGRAKFEAYFQAWNLYLILLVAFGLLISVIIRKDSISMSQFLGVVLAAISISLIIDR